MALSLEPNFSTVVCSNQTYSFLPHKIFLPTQPNKALDLELITVRHDASPPCIIFGFSVPIARTRTRADLCIGDERPPVPCTTRTQRWTGYSSPRIKSNGERDREQGISTASAASGNRLVRRRLAAPTRATAPPPSVLSSTTCRLVRALITWWVRPATVPNWSASLSCSCNWTKLLMDADG